MLDAPTTPSVLAALAAEEAVPATARRPVLALPTAGAPTASARVATSNGWLGPSPSPLTLARAFMAVYGEALADAVHTLGGETGGRRHARLVGDLRRGALTDGQAVREVRNLHELLTLRHVGDPGREESGCFAMINPDHPMVHDFCRVAEAVGALLGEMREAADRRRANGGRTRAVVVEGGRGGSADRTSRAREVASRPANRAARTWRALAAGERLFGGSAAQAASSGDPEQGSASAQFVRAVTGDGPRLPQPMRAGSRAGRPGTPDALARRERRKRSKAPRAHRQAPGTRPRRTDACGTRRSRR